MRKWMNLFENENLLKQLTWQIRENYKGRFQGSCEGAAGDLAELLAENGIAAKIIQGMYDHPYDHDGVTHPTSSHVWVEVGDYILDPTREQFYSNNLMITKWSPSARKYDGWEELKEE